MSRSHRIMISALVVANVISAYLLVAPAEASQSTPCPDQKCRGAYGPCDYGFYTQCVYITESPPWCQTSICQDA